MNDSATAGAVRAHGDVALDVLERKLQLLQRQRHISALRCQLFLDQLDLAMAECTFGDDSPDSGGSEDSDDADYADHADCSDYDDEVSSSEHGGECEKERNADASLGYVYRQENACNAKGRRPSSSRWPANPSLPPSFSASSSPRAAGNTNDNHHHHRQRFSHDHHLHRNHEQIKGGHRSPAGGGSLTASPRGPLSNQQSTESSPRRHTAPVLAARRGVLVHEIVTSRSLSSPVTTKLSRGHGHRDINQHSTAASPWMSLESPPPCSSSCLKTWSTPSSPMAASAESNGLKHGTSSPRATAARTFTRHNSDNHRSALSSPRHGPLLSRLGRPSVAVPSPAARVLSRTRTEPASRATVQPMSLTSAACGALPPFCSRSPGPPATSSPAAAQAGRQMRRHARLAWPDASVAAAAAADAFSTTVAASPTDSAPATSGHLTDEKCTKGKLRTASSGKGSSSTSRSCRTPNKYAAFAFPTHAAAGGLCPGDRPNACFSAAAVCGRGERQLHELWRDARLQWAQSGEVSHASSASDLTSLQQEQHRPDIGLRFPESQISPSGNVNSGTWLDEQSYGPGWSHCNQQMLHHLPSNAGNAATYSDTASLGKCDTLSPGAGNGSPNASATCCACLCEHEAVLQDASTGAAVAAATSETSAPVTAPPVTPATDAALPYSLAAYDSDGDVMEWNAHTGYARDDDGSKISPDFSNMGASMAKVSRWLHAHV